MSQSEFGNPTYARAAGRRAFAETLQADHAVAYVDENGLNVLQQPDGRRFEIRWTAPTPAAANFEIVRELQTRRS